MEDSGEWSIYTDGIVMSNGQTSHPQTFTYQTLPGLYSQTSHMSSIFDNNLITKTCGKCEKNVENLT